MTSSPARGDREYSACGPMIIVAGLRPAHGAHGPPARSLPKPARQCSWACGPLALLAGLRPARPPKRVRRILAVCPRRVVRGVKVFIHLGAVTLVYTKVVPEYLVTRILYADVATSTHDR